MTLLKEDGALHCRFALSFSGGTTVCIDVYVYPYSGAIFNKDIPSKHRQARADLSRHSKRQMEPCSTDKNCATEVRHSYWPHTNHYSVARLHRNAA